MPKSDCIELQILGCVNFRVVRKSPNEVLIRGWRHFQRKVSFIPYVLTSECGSKGTYFTAELVPVLSIKCAVFITCSNRLGCSSTLADRNIQAFAIL